MTLARSDHIFCATALATATPAAPPAAIPAGTRPATSVAPPEANPGTPIALNTPARRFVCSLETTASPGSRSAGKISPPPYPGIFQPVERGGPGLLLPAGCVSAQPS